MSDRKKFTPQFKADAVALVLSSGRPIAQVPPEIGVVEGTCGSWPTSYTYEGLESDHRSRPRCSDGSYPEPYARCPRGRWLPTCAQLIIDALVMARDHGRLAQTGAVFHSDRGSHYTSTKFQNWCAANHLTQSMGAVGVCWDNAVAESFFAHLKTEMFHQQSFPNHLSARTAVMEYIEVRCNRQRPHRHNGGISPAAARTAHQTRAHEPVAA